MKKLRYIPLAIVVTLLGCYDAEDDLTAIPINQIVIEDELRGDGFSLYEVSIDLPGVQFGDPKSVTLRTNWGIWRNDSSEINVSIPYNQTLNAYKYTLKLKASRLYGEFQVSVTVGNNYQELDISVGPSYPNRIQILADSVTLKNKSGNSSKLKALLFSEVGFVSENLLFQFALTTTNSAISIQPLEVRVKDGVAEGEVILNTNVSTGTIEITGSIPANESMAEVVNAKISIQE